MSISPDLNMNRHSTARSFRILIAEDSDDLQTLLRYNLEAMGFSVIAARDGEEAELLLSEEAPDLLILDWMMPGVSGIELLRRLRRASHTAALPVIVLTARSDEADRIRALETGADDYIVKPFSMEELLARIRALLRRMAPNRMAQIVTVGDIELDRDAMEFRRRGRVLRLGPTEYRLLEFFIECPGRVLAREAIMNAVWGADSEIDERTVDVHIGRLRKHLMIGCRTDPITTVRGAGYRFDAK